MTRSNTLQRFILIVGSVLLSAAAHSADSLTYADLVQRLYDVKHLAEPPAAGEKSGSFTSADREAIYNATTGRYEKWWANDGDGMGAIRTEGDGAIVAAEIKGPGVIWRVWSAYPRQGHIKYFIDGAESPVLDMPFADYFNNQKAPFNYPELTHVVSRGYNSYVPIAFEKSIKIVLEKEWGAYYQFTYTLFPDGTSVPSFKGSFNDAEKAALTKANKILGRRGVQEPVNEAGELLTRDLLIPPGGTVKVADIRGPRAITSIRVTPLDFGGAASPGDSRRDLGDAGGRSDNRSQDIQILRQLVMQVAWDNERDPSVWTPLGDFFGTAPGINRYRSLPMGMTSDDLYSRWYMPFSKRAVLELKNDGRETRRLRIAVAHQPEPRADRLLRFHAKWHRDDFGSRDANRYLTGDRWPDWPVLMAQGGPGRFCGFHLHVWNPNPQGSKREAILEGWGNLSQEKTALLDRLVKEGAWWGEGDEKFFVDGEKFPSTFGTGSEDYFGYAFAAFYPEVFDSAFQSLPLNRNNYGHVSNVRFQVADNVPFQRSFEAVIEKYHPNAWPLLYAATAYWYQAAGAVDTYKPVPRDQRLNYFVEVPRSTDIYEAEQLDVEHIDSGEVVFDAWNMQYSARHAIVWRNADKAGDRLVLKLLVEENGEFDILFQLGRNLDAGTYRVSLDGKPLGSEIDLGGAGDLDKVEQGADTSFFQHSQYAARLEEISAGRVPLIKGDHELSFEAIKPGRGGKFILPIDFIRLRKVAKRTDRAC